MTEQRPLVWLSANNEDSILRLAMAGFWSLRGFAFTESLPIMLSVPDNTKLGVLELASPHASAEPMLERWLEALGLTYWVGVVPHPPVTGTPSARLITRYCSDFHTQPVDINRLNTVLGHLWGMATMQEPDTETASEDYQNLVLTGDSLTIRQIRALLRRFAATHEAVLIIGESGTGKDAAAKFIHQHSARASGPLVLVNCAALPDTLTQSELFGYEKGAFTHALTSRSGRLEQASGGTLVLSGIDELNLDQQSTILRFLQEGQIERLGGKSPIPINSRIVTTASRPPQGLIASGQFRSDVYYRLGGLEVRLPALRERPEDIPRLARALLQSCSQGAEKKHLNNAAIRSLMTHSWPGNIRELQNRVRQAALLCDRAHIGPADLGLAESATGTGPPANLSLEGFRGRADRQALSCSLTLAHNNVSEAARILKISRVSFYRLMDKYQSGPRHGHSLQGRKNKGNLP